MLLVIDIGNTNITIGVYKEDHLVGAFSYDNTYGTYIR